MFLTVDPVTNYIRYIKLALVIGIIVLIGGMALYIKIQAVDLESAERKLASSEEINEILNSRIRDQNAKIKEAAAKFDLVQSALNNNKITNALLKEQFDRLRGDLKDKPLPTNCDEITQELVDTSKKVVSKWKK